MVRRFFLCCLLLSLSVFLHGAEPFEWKAETVDGQLAVTVQISPGYYLTLDTLVTEIKDANGKLPPVISKPRRQEINDPDSGKSYILPEGVWKWVYGGTPPYQVKVAFQGCRKGAPGEAAVCLMPQELQLTGIKTPAAKLESKAVRRFYHNWKVVKQYSGAMDKKEFLSFLEGESKALPEQRNMFADKSLWLVILLTILGGLGLNLTPCVLPMIPINLAIIGGGGEKRQCVFRGILYGTGMAIAYGVLGAVVVYTGSSFGALNSSSWFNFAVAAVFVALAVAMLGFFDLDLSRFSKITPGQIKGGKNIAAFVMGVLAALLAGACVAPVVVGVMLFAAGLHAEGNVFAPFMGLFLGIGMGLPWPLAAAGVGVLPKPGKFMVTVKYLFSALIICGACYYGYLGWSLLPGNFSPEAELAKLAEAGKRAKAENKKVVIDFYATWCKNCMAMKRSVLSDPEVRQALKKCVFVEFQAEKPGDPLIEPLLKLWKVPGFPAFVIAEP